jgi:hypothetical protein
MRKGLVIGMAFVLVAVMSSATTMNASAIEGTEEAKLTASDGDLGDAFGLSVSIDGDTVVVGAIGDDDQGIVAGSAYVYTRSGTSWSEQQKLLGSSTTAGDNFGRSVSIEQAALTASDPAEGDIFGWSVAIDGDTVVVGASYDDDNGLDSGSAYVFTRSGTRWSQEAKLTASDGASGDWFGDSVAIGGDTVVVGSPYHDTSSTDTGSAYVFTRSGTTWSQQAKLTASDAAADDALGGSVSIDGDTIIAGAYGANSTGAAYAFTRSGTTWSQQAKLTASDGGNHDQFGLSVAIQDDIAVIGARLDDDNGGDSGSTYIFVRSGTSWSETDKILASDGAAYDWFGYAVSLDDDTAVIGAYKDDTFTGSAYVFTLASDIEGMFEDLIDAKEAMGLQDGFETALDATLENARESYRDGDDGVAMNQLNAFMNQVEAHRGNRLTEAQADFLAAAAQEIIDAINAL